ncbi:response regulator transcription factor [Agromyces seonyuensis]|uniref:Response regulator n=1 Tax=Agromyces seonyuensis TaxID=2662446 RepID=A0A6I4P4W8_9MICO|nr:response regulator transcription factor [Agromyces seonyuensis]MWB99995.1 response regulator [Agromyces seonyuensis]
MGDVSTGEPIRVVVVDDDPMVRSALATMLGVDPGILLVGEAGDGEEGIDVVQRERPDVVLMDVRMPVRDGLSATTAVLRLPEPPRVVILTTFDADDTVLEALRLGASGFLLKDTPPDRLAAAIRDAAAGAPALSPSVASQVIAAATAPGRARADDARAAARARLGGLTPRERDVARELGAGRSNAEIAAALFLSVPTVKAHVGAILAKSRAENRVQLALLVHDAGLDADA